MDFLWTLLLFPFLVVEASHDEWSYRGPKGVSEWAKKVDKRCGGSRQSPVQIKKKDAKTSQRVDKIRVFGYDRVTQGTAFTLLNNGHTVKVEIRPGKPMDYTAFDCLTSGLFVPKEFHFHFGSSSKNGSEHIVESEKYAMEMHLVHYNAFYPDFEVLDKWNGIYVISVPFKLSTMENPVLRKVVENLDKVNTPGSEKKIRPFPLNDLLPRDTTDFYWYEGSLTTPPCAEVVTWNIFKTAMPVSQDQLDEFRSLVSNEKDKTMMDNIRPPQKLEKGRTVYMSSTSRKGKL